MLTAADRLKNFDANAIFNLCREFLGGPWQNVSIDKFRYTPLEQGMGNRLVVCQIDDTAHDGDVPRKVLVRMLGGNFLPKDAPIRSLNETGETLVFYALGVCGLGPKLYGVFPGGRIEQFIESRTLTLTEWLTDDTVNKEVAVIAGKFHCINLPIARIAWDIPAKVATELQKFQEKKQMLTEKGYLAQPFAQALLQFDFTSEIEFVKSVLVKLKQRIVFTSNDMNRSNFLRLTDTKTGTDKHPCELMAIDYEFSSYNYRGYDLGNYFGMKVFDFGSKEIFTGQDYPSEKYERSFVEKYVETIRNSPNRPSDWDETGIDSIEHILMEIEFGSFAIRLINLAWLLRDLDVFAELHKKEPRESERKEEPFSTFYQQRKQDFLIKYPQFSG